MKDPEGTSEIYFNDELAATSTDNGASWTWESNYNNFAQVLFKDGSQTALNSETLSLDGDSVGIHADWAGSIKVGNNTAYMYMVLKWDPKDKFGGGAPNITFIIQGKKVKRIGSAYNSTLSYSNNPARCLYDYLVNPHMVRGSHTRYLTQHRLITA